VPLGEDGADQADEGVAAGEDSDDVGAAADFPVESFYAYLEPAGCGGAVSWVVVSETLSLRRLRGGWPARWAALVVTG
jgi:hypothetical protein